MTSTNRNVNVVFSVDGADASRQEVGKVREAIESFGDEGKASAQKLIAPLQNIEREFDKVNSKIAAGKTVTVRDVGAMVQQFDLLEREIRNAFGSLDKAPAAMQTAFRKAETQIDSTKKKVRELTDAVDDQKGTLKEGGERWGGLGDAVDKAAGKHGKLVGQIGLVTAAFTEGWNIGMRLNKFFGTDMSLWDEAITRFGQKANAIVRAASDNLVGLINVVMSVFSGNIGEVKKSVKEFTDNLANYGAQWSAVLTKGGTEWDAYAKKQGLVTQATKDNTTAQDANKESTSSLGGQKKELSEKTDDAAKSLKTETEELENQAPAHLAAIQRHEAQNAVLGSYEGNLNQASGALAAQSAKIQELSDRLGANNPLTLAAVERQREMKVEVDDLAAKLQNATQAAGGLAKQHGEMTQATAKASESFKTQQGALTQWLAIAKKAQADAAAEQAKHHKSAADQLIVYKDAMDQWAITQRGIVEGTKNYARTADEAKEANDRQTESIRRIREEAELAVTALANLAAGIKAVGEAGDGT